MGNCAAKEHSGVELQRSRGSKRKTIKKNKSENHKSLAGRRRAHLSDGRAELTLEDLLQRLELVAGDVARLLQLLQQLYRPGDIWQGRGNVGEEREKIKNTSEMCVRGNEGSDE